MFRPETATHVSVRSALREDWKQGGSECVSLVPRAPPHFLSLAVREPGIFLIWVWCNNFQSKPAVLHISFNRLTHSILGVYDSQPLLARYKWLVFSLFLLFSASLCPCTLKTFLPSLVDKRDPSYNVKILVLTWLLACASWMAVILFNPDVTHVRKIPGSLLLFHTTCVTKNLQTKSLNKRMEKSLVSQL